MDVESPSASISVIESVAKLAVVGGDVGIDVGVAVVGTDVAGGNVGILVGNAVVGVYDGLDVGVDDDGLDVVGIWNGLDDGLDDGLDVDIVVINELHAI